MMTQNKVTVRRLDRIEYFEIDGKYYKVEFLRLVEGKISKVDSICISTEYRSKYFNIDQSIDIIEFIKKNEKNLL